MTECVPTTNNELPLLRFIPFRRTDIIRMCLQENRLDPSQQARFHSAAEHIENWFRHDFHSIKQELKDAYAPLDPDTDTRVIEGIGEQQVAPHAGLSANLERVLERANYEKIGPEQLQAAFDSASLFHIRLHVDLDDYEEVLLYYRGASEREELTKPWFGFFQRTVRFTNYNRVVLFIRIKENIDTQSTLGGCRPGTTMLKLFQNVPDADLEMLFPNTRVGMRTLDKLMIGVPAVISGGAMITTKVGTTLLLLGSLLGFWLGIASEPVQLDRGMVLALLAALGALGGYFWKQFSSFRNRKLKFTQALTENLYFKLLDNNAGVLYRILDEAEESECKESLLAYFFLLAHGGPVSATALDAAIESWFAARWQCRLDFDVLDALHKLQQLELATYDGQHWQVPASAAAIE